MISGRKHRLLLPVLTSALCSSTLCTSAWADMLDTSGMAAWETCALCHSADGISVMAKFPKLAGQKPEYIIKQLNDFRQGHRANDGGQMKAIVGEISPETASSIADYFASLPAPAGEKIEDRAGFERGEALFHRGTDDLPACASCHSDPESDAPWLFGQHQAYLEKQIVDFRLGRRENDPGGIMQGIAKGLSNADVKAVANYLRAVSEASLQRPSTGAYSDMENTLRHTEKKQIFTQKELVITSYDK